VGVETRTEDAACDPWWGLRPICAQKALAGFLGAQERLGGRASLGKYAGGGAPCPEPRGLKSAADLYLQQVSTPRLPARCR
jgi:hypothetical protein